MPANKEEYISICNQRKDIPLFSQPWWIDSVRGNSEWDAIVVRGKNGNTIGAMPYILNKNLWFVSVTYPLSCQHLGVHIFYPGNCSDNYHRELFANLVCESVIEKISELKCSRFIQNFPPNFTDWRPFYYNGYKSHVRYTYIIEDIRNPKSVISSFSTNKQRQIAKAANNGYVCDTNITADEFADFHKNCYLSNGKKNLADTEVIRKTATEMLRRESGKIIACKKDGKLCGAFLMPFDIEIPKNSEKEGKAYFIWPAVSDEHKQLGIGSLLVSFGIEIASKYVRSFDFEGSMDAGIASSYRQFATKTVPYLCIEKYFDKALFLINCVRKHIR